MLRHIVGWTLMVAFVCLVGSGRVRAQAPTYDTGLPSRPGGGSSSLGSSPGAGGNVLGRTPGGGTAVLSGGDQGGAPISGHGMKHEVAIGIAENLYPAGSKPELLGNADRLTVAVHEYTAESSWHKNPLYILLCVYFEESGKGCQQASVLSLV